MTRSAFGLLVIAALAGAGEAAAQNVDNGRSLATRWCAACHVVDRTTTTAPADGVPGFPALARRSVAELRAAMNPLHSRMPDFALSKAQQDDLAAYIKSLGN